MKNCVIGELGTGGGLKKVFYKYLDYNPTIVNVEGYSGYSNQINIVSATSDGGYVVGGRIYSDNIIVGDIKIENTEEKTMGLIVNIILKIK